MPSPIAHCSLALLGWPALSVGGRPDGGRWRRTLLLASLLGALVGPDVDIVLDPLLLGQPAFTNHGGPTHSLVAGLVFGLLFAVWCRCFTRIGWARLYLVGAAAWCSHALLDAATYGRGPMLLWPLTTERVTLPFPLFYGVRHSEGASLLQHGVTVASELLFLLLIWAILRWCRGSRRSERTPRGHIGEVAA